MKCAMELMAIANISSRLNELEKQAKELETRKVRLAATFQFCERLGKELESKAEKGEKLEIFFECSKQGTVLTRTRQDYADHRLSYRPSTLDIDLQVLKNWFAEYCFKTAVEKIEFDEYGCGRCSGYQVTITPDTQCLSDNQFRI